MLRYLPGCLLIGCLIFSGCESDDDDSGSASTASSSVIDLSSVVWLHSDVSSWAETATLSVSISSSTITLDYDKANVWNGYDASGSGKDVNANPWIFVNLDGVWYAATFEWLGVGQTSKPSYVVNGDHIKVSPLNDFSPTSGTEYGFMVSGLARTSSRNVEERTPVVMATWP